MNPEVWWYLSRSSAIVAYAMLTASVLWGVFLASGLFGARRAAWLLDLHRWLGAMTVVFVAGHMVTLVLDSSVQFALADLLVPFASEWRPGAVALGVGAFWLVLLVQGTSLLAKRLPRRWWRGVHMFAYVSFWMTSVHGALAGTDSSRLVYVASSGIAVAAVVAAVTHRVIVRRGARGRRSGGARPEDAAPADARS